MIKRQFCYQTARCYPGSASAFCRGQNAPRAWGPGLGRGFSSDPGQDGHRARPHRGRSEIPSGVARNVLWQEVILPGTSQVLLMCGYVQ